MHSTYMYIYIHRYTYTFIYTYINMPTHTWIFVGKDTYHNISNVYMHVYVCTSVL